MPLYLILSPWRPPKNDHIQHLTPKRHFFMFNNLKKAHYNLINHFLLCDWKIYDFVRSAITSKKRNVSICLILRDNWNQNWTPQIFSYELYPYAIQSSVKRSCIIKMYLDTLKIGILTSETKVIVKLSNNTFCVWGPFNKPHCLVALGKKLSEFQSQRIGYSTFSANNSPSFSANDLIPSKMKKKY